MNCGAVVAFAMSSTEPGSGVSGAVTCAKAGAMQKKNKRPVRAH
jgi:hypothetical protein